MECISCNIGTCDLPEIYALVPMLPLLHMLDRTIFKPLEGYSNNIHLFVDPVTFVMCFGFIGMHKHRLLSIFIFQYTPCLL